MGSRNSPQRRRPSLEHQLTLNLNFKMFARSAARLTKQVSVMGTRSYSEMAFTFASSKKVFYNASAIRQADVPSLSGSFGILPEHVPTLAVLKPGVLTVIEGDGATKKYFVSSGSVSVNEDSSVQILAEEAHLLEDIDVAAARDLLAKSNAEVNSASGEEAKAAAMIAQETAEELVKAAESAQAEKLFIFVQ